MFFKPSLGKVPLDIMNIVLFFTIEIVDLDSTCILLDSLDTFEHVVGSHFTLQHHLMGYSNLINITPQILFLTITSNICHSLVYFADLVIHSDLHKSGLKFLLPFVVCNDLAEK